MFKKQSLGEGRLQYLFFWLQVLGLSVLAGIITFILLGIFDPYNVDDGVQIIVYGLLCVFYAMIIIACFMHTKDRLKDIGLLGWISIVLLIPVLNLILVLLLLGVPGEVRKRSARRA